MADFDSLLRYRDAAETANGNSQELLRCYARKPTFAVKSRDTNYAEQERFREAKELLSRARNNIERIMSARKEFQKLAGSDLLELVQQAVGLKAPAIAVGHLSWPTAHEASFALGEAVIEAWANAGALWGIEQGGKDAMDALRCLYRQLRRLGRRAPSDLWGRIQQEFWEASELAAGEGCETTPMGRLREKVRITRDEANVRAREALNNPKIRSARKLAAAIGCSVGLVARLPAWRAYQEGLEKLGIKTKSPKAVGLSKAVEMDLGQNDSELQGLIGEQRTEDLADQRHYRRRRRL